LDGSYLPCGGAVSGKVDTWKRTADGHGVGSCRSVLMGGIPGVGFVIGRFVFAPVYGVAVASSCCRDSNGFVVRGCLPGSDEGFGIVLCPSEESEQDSED